VGEGNLVGGSSRGRKKTRGGLIGVRILRNVGMVAENELAINGRCFNCSGEGMGKRRQPLGPEYCKKIKVASRRAGTA